MHQAGRLVKHALDELEPELLEDCLGGAIIRVVPGKHFRKVQLLPAELECAQRCLGSKALAPTALHEMEPDLKIGFIGRIDPGPQPGATDEIVIAESNSGQY